MIKIMYKRDMKRLEKLYIENTNSKKIYILLMSNQTY